MLNLHAGFCDLPPTGDAHGPNCVSEPVGREVIASSDFGERVGVTIDLAARWPHVRDAPPAVRFICEPAEVERRAVLELNPGCARQLAAALIQAAAIADELKCQH